MKCVNCVAIAWTLVALASCGGELMEAPAASEDRSRQVLESLEEDLSEGDYGEEVQAVQDLLSRAGYFPNHELSKRFPNWHPVLEAPPEVASFDAVTLEATLRYQEDHGLPPTGIIDEATRASMKTDRCGFPQGTFAADTGEKFNHHANGFTVPNLTYRVDTATIPARYNLNATAVRNAVWNAIKTWQDQQSYYTFTAITSGTPNVLIRFGTSPGGADCPWPGVAGVANQTIMTFNDALADDYWSTASPTPTNGHDIQSVALHEMGHCTGLAHSAFCSSPQVSGCSNHGLGHSAMYPNVIINNRTLGIDDKMSSNVRYDRFQTLPDSAKDIGVSSILVTPVAWIISSTPSSATNFKVKRWNDTSGVWETEATAAGVRIAVQSNGLPLVVNAAGALWKKTSAASGSGNWTQPFGTSCTKDVGSLSDDNTWRITCTASGSNYTIQKWDHLNQQWVNDSAGGAAQRITVGVRSNHDGTFVPWVVNAAGEIYRRTTGNPTAGSWERMNGAGKDIGACVKLVPGKSMYYGLTFVTGTTAVTGGFRVWQRMEQNAPPGDGSAATWGATAAAADGGVACDAGALKLWTAGTSSIYRTIR